MSYVNSQDANGDSLLMIASKNGNMEIVNFLLSKGADPNLVNVNYYLLLHTPNSLITHEE
jgi:ankyrin repeat protein